MSRLKRWGWLALAVGFSVLSIPWFLWNNATVVAGVPLWLWWHVGWMGLASIVAWLFAQHAWGVGIEPAAAGSTDGEQPGQGHNAEPGGESR